ncbi:hypothetical protein COCC4DRAFT_64725 [Bipolaris maydis ATCC 48331]|uniref:Uncharacterized protein n=2 Tax=Cochliobolus heterostrophus TaxID=5016 RepID=M2V352_COCH5|nr:uncharacterized protein COCC4DRAFT_64725 [Bipolaris maydis ATCC 48331]EMD94458.1 hypothetical protein COCHEDRAFT_1028342 [Bipolaris maydis C5]ENI01201.1 hypothetical protein COCC4DRAFT_64725 [Bipolaris maydis ATCC 48331]
MCASMDSVPAEMEADGIVMAVFGNLMVMSRLRQPIHDELEATFMTLASLSEEMGKFKVQLNIAKDNTSSYRTTCIVLYLRASFQGQEQCVQGVANMLRTADITNRPSGADQDDGKEPSAPTPGIGIV